MGNLLRSDHVIEKTVRVAAGNMHYMLKPFFPALTSPKRQNCDINEANISFQFMHALLSWRPGSGGYFEVPFVPDPDQYGANDNRYDFFVHDGPVENNGSVGIVGETKMLYSPRNNNLDGVDQDLKKMSVRNVQNMLQICAKDRPHYQKVLRLLLAGTWEQKFVDLWTEGGPKLPTGRLLSDMTYDAIPVARYPAASVLKQPSPMKQTLYLLYAYNEV